jgi:hypothetical protein
MSIENRERHLIREPGQDAAVLIGAFNNGWTLQMTARLMFTFIDEGETGKIWGISAA